VRDAFCSVTYFDCKGWYIWVYELLPCNCECIKCGFPKQLLSLCQIMNEAGRILTYSEFSNNVKNDILRYLIIQKILHTENGIQYVPFHYSNVGHTKFIKLSLYLSYFKSATETLTLRQ
jgi:hypothetical protein